MYVYAHTHTFFVICMQSTRPSGGSHPDRTKTSHVSEINPWNVEVVYM